MQRKNWTEYQDQILKYLKQERKIKRWTDIAKIMNTQYKISGRNGKQCRQRYHSHLQRVFPKRPWNRKEQLELLQLHSEIGNKWSRIAQKMIDRSDNNIKNHFYSKLRRAARKVNKFISRIYYKQKKQIKFNDVYLIMEIFQAKFRGNCEWQDYQSDQAQNLKNRLFILALDEDQTAEQQTDENIGLAKDIVIFLDQIKKIHKRTRGKPRSYQDNLYSPDVKKSDRKSEIELNISVDNIEIKQSQTTIEQNCVNQTPKTVFSSCMNMNSSSMQISDYDELSEISSLILENSDILLEKPSFVDNTQNMDNKSNSMSNSLSYKNSVNSFSSQSTSPHTSIDSLLQSIMSSSSLQSFSSQRLFEWNQTQNLFRSSDQLQNIILMDFSSKQIQDKYDFNHRSLLD